MEAPGNPQPITCSCKSGFGLTKGGFALVYYPNTIGALYLMPRYTGGNGVARLMKGFSGGRCIRKINRSLDLISGQASQSQLFSSCLAVSADILRPAPKTNFGLSANQQMALPLSAPLFLRRRLPSRKKLAPRSYSRCKTSAIVAWTASFRGAAQTPFF